MLRISIICRWRNGASQSLPCRGYHTWHVGKWHLGDAPYYPDQHGFEVNIGGCATGLPNRGYWSPWNIPTLPDGPFGEYLTDRLTDEAIRLIHNNNGQPFFLNLWHYVVHTPMQAPPHLVQKYEAKAHALGLHQQTAFAYGKVFPCEHTKDQRITRRLLQSDPVYAAMIENLDANIGRLLDVVDQAGLAQNTVVMVTSDNGGLATSEGSPTSNAPLAEGKGWMYEGGTRVPLIVAGPGVAPQLCATPVTSPDLYPTLLQLAGLDPIPEQHCDGVSLMPLLHGAGVIEREAIFWHYPHYGNQGGTPGSAVRSGEYKLIEWYEDRRVELYNLGDDIGETHDLRAAQPDVVARLHGLLQHWREQIEAKIPAPNPVYTPRYGARLMDVTNVLAAWAIPTPWHVRPDTHIANNIVQIVDTPAGSFVFRLYQPDRQLSQIRCEHAVTTALQGADLPFAVPAPIPARSGDTLIDVSTEDGHRFASLWPLVPGAIVHGPSMAQLRRIGQALGQLDQTLASMQMAVTPDLLPPPSYRNLHHFHPLVPDPLAAIATLPIDASLQARLSNVVQALTVAIPPLYGTLPQQQIHNDYDPGNVLLSGDQVSAVLDWEFSTVDLRAMDLVVALLGWATAQFGSGQEWHTIDALGCGYRSRVPLTAAEIEALPLLLRLRATTSLMHRIGRYRYDPHTRTGLLMRVTSAIDLDDWLQTHAAQLVSLARSW